MPKYPNRVIPQTKKRQTGTWVSGLENVAASGSSRMVYYGILCNNNLLRSKLPDL